MVEPTAATTAPMPFVIEQNLRLSQTILWRRHRNFYERMGIDAWYQNSLGIDTTNNPFIANAYAQVVLGWLRDCQAGAKPSLAGATLAALDLRQPIYILELGAGSGRLAYLFLKHLDPWRHSVLKDVPFKYVLTDLPERNVEYWLAHPSLQPFIEGGVLDVARFDAVQDQKLVLRHSGEVLSPQTIKNPLVVLANYFFDSLPQDVFVIQEGQLREGLVTVSTPTAEPDTSDLQLRSVLDISYHPHPLNGEPYDDGDFNRILRGYERRLPDIDFLFPIGALQCIRTLHQLSNGRLLLLSGDYGYDRDEDIIEKSPPDLDLEESSYLEVNYDTLGQYFENRGGQTLRTSYRPSLLNITAFMGPDAPGGAVETRQAFQEAIEKKNPDDLFSLRRVVENNYEAMSLQELLGYLRLSGWDATILMGASQALLNRLEAASNLLKEEMYNTAQRVWELYYPIGPKPDLAFALGTLLLKIEYYEKALSYFQHSLRNTGANPNTFFFKGLCHYGLGQVQAAVECMDRTLELDPAYEAAKVLRLSLQSELEAQGH